MKRIITSLIFLGIVGLPFITFADSPLTSTYFASVYSDIPIVTYASENGEVDQKIADYLLKRGNPLDVKAAVVNALSWKFEGKNNVDLFKTFIAKHFKKSSFTEVKEKKIKGDVWLCLGYLTALDDYFNPAKALPYFEKVKKKKFLRSFTFQVIYAIVKAQVAFDSDWCRVWTEYESVENNSKLKNDFREEAKIIIRDYLFLYQSSCE